MPKSRNRAKHKQAVASYKIKMENQKRTLQRMNREFYENLQKEQFQKMTAEGNVQNVVDSENLDLDLDLGLNNDVTLGEDMGLDDIVDSSFEETPIEEPVVEFIQPSNMLEGVTSPDQLKK